MGWYSEISTVDNPEDFIESLDSSGIPRLVKVADRLKALQVFYTENPNEEEPLTIEALQTLASFINNNFELPLQHISLWTENKIYLEWSSRPTCWISMILSPDEDLVSFSALSFPNGEDTRKEEVTGKLPEKHAIESVKWFMDKI